MNGSLTSRRLSSVAAPFAVASFLFTYFSYAMGAAEPAI
jgi:hypothetical protein